MPDGPTETTETRGQGTGGEPGATATGSGGTSGGEGSPIITQSDLENLKKEFLELRSSVKESAPKNMEILAIFVALLAFVSGEVSLYKRLDEPWFILTFSLVLLGGLTFFVAIFDSLINKDSFFKFGLFLLIISTVFIALGLLLIFYVKTWPNI